MAKFSLFFFFFINSLFIIHPRFFFFVVVATVRKFAPKKMHWSPVFNYFFIISCCSKSADQSKEDLAKSGYKTNREVENLGIRLHVGEPPYLIS